MRRLVVAGLLVALIPPAVELPALAARGLFTAVMIAMIASEAMHYSEVREQIRHEDVVPEAALGNRAGRAK